MRRFVAGPVLGHACERHRRGRETTAAEAAAGCRVSRRAAQRALEFLARRGLTERRAPGRYVPTAEGVRLAAEGARIVSGPTGPHVRARGARRNTFQARLWAALRQLRKATIPELIQIAATGGERDPEAIARPYLRALVAAGICVQRGRTKGARPGSNGFKKYLLVRDPGPGAPVLDRRRGILRDTNSGKEHEIRTGREARP